MSGSSFLKTSSAFLINTSSGLALLALTVVATPVILTADVFFAIVCFITSVKIEAYLETL